MNRGLHLGIKSGGEQEEWEMEQGGDEEGEEE